MFLLTIIEIKEFIQNFLASPLFFVRSAFIILRDFRVEKFVVNLIERGLGNETNRNNSDGA